MKNKHLVVLIIILSIVAIISSPSNRKTAFFNDATSNNSLADNPSTKGITVRIKRADDSIINLNLEDYIIGVVAGEMPASFHEEALKAQAIAARTYALNKINASNSNYDLVTDNRNQVYIDESEMQRKWLDKYEYYYNKIKQAVVETKDLIMRYDGEIINAYYFAMSNGKTEDAVYAFSEQADYLVSVDSSFEENNKNFLVNKEMTTKEFKDKLGIENGNIMIQKVERTPSNRVNKITINSKEYTGTEIRKLLDLRSTDFKIVITDKIIITTKGYGHGVGMSQYGANYLANNGKDFKDILRYYYQNVNIEKI